MHVCMSIGTGSIYMAIWATVSLGDIQKLACDLEIISGMQKQSSTVVLVSA